MFLGRGIRKDRSAGSDTSAASTKRAKFKVDGGVPSSPSLITACCVPQSTVVRLSRASEAGSDGFELGIGVGRLFDAFGGRGIRGRLGEFCTAARTSVRNLGWFRRVHGKTDSGRKSEGRKRHPRVTGDAFDFDSGSCGETLKAGTGIIPRGQDG